MCGLVLSDTDWSGLKDEGYSLRNFPSDIFVVIIRFACGLTMHIILQDEFEIGLNNMKFVANHPYRFKSIWTAFMASFMQATAALVIETVNLIQILQSNGPLSVIANFMVLAVIAELDNLFYIALRSNAVKQVLEDVINKETESMFSILFRITRTTSMQMPTKQQDPRCVLTPS